MPNSTGITSYDRHAPRKPVNLSLNEDRVSRAKDLTRNLSGKVDELPAAHVPDEQAGKRADYNRLDEVISVLSARHERDGFLSDEFSCL